MQRDWQRWLAGCTYDRQYEDLTNDAGSGNQGGNQQRSLPVGVVTPRAALQRDSP